MRGANEIKATCKNVTCKEYENPLKNLQNVIMGGIV